MANQYTKKKTVAKKKTAVKPIAHPKTPMEQLPPSFTLFTSDNLSTLVIAYWLQLAEQRGVSASKISSARKRLAEMEEHRRLNPWGCKLPD